MNSDSVPLLESPSRMLTRKIGEAWKSLGASADEFAEAFQRFSEVVSSMEGRS